MIGMKTALLALTAGAFCAPHAALANGGTFATSSVYSTGNLVPVRKQKIELENETLHVVLEGDWASVEVIYSIRNRGGADAVTYGFPIDTAQQAEISGDSGLSGDSSIKDFQMFDGGKRLEITRVIKEATSDGSYTERPYDKTVRNWFTAELHFDRREEKTLAVSYKVKSGGTESGTSNNFWWEQSPRTFTYTFKPAASWGDGRLRHLDILVDTSQLKNAQIPINYVRPGGWREENGQLHWGFENVELSKAPDLVFNYDNNERQLDAFVTSYRLDSKLIASIRASSTHPDSRSTKAAYDVHNLLDGKLDTAWLEGAGGVGVGEWIDVTFKHPNPPEGHRDFEWLSKVRRKPGGERPGH